MVDLLVKITVYTRCPYNIKFSARIQLRNQRSTGAKIHIAVSEYSALRRIHIDSGIDGIPNLDSCGLLNSKH